MNKMFREGSANLEVVYIDMDGVLVDFDSGIRALSEEDYDKYHGRFDEHPEIFRLMKPMPGAIDAFIELSNYYDVYILSTPPWDNPNAAAHKFEWVKKYLPEHAYKRVILSHHKNLCTGEYLIDDRTANGANLFEGEHIHFGKDDKFMDWNSVLEYLLCSVK